MAWNIARGSCALVALRFKCSALASWAIAPTWTLKPFAADATPLAGACFSALAVGAGAGLAAWAGAGLLAGAGVTGGADAVFTGGATFADAAFDGIDDGTGAAFASAFVSGCFAAGVASFV